jgi:serine/threonine protein kinase
MKCPKCHSENPDTSRFCGTCAALLSAEAQGPPSVTKTLETPIHVLTKGSSVARKYKIIEEIGHGGMGVVYKAEDTKLKRTVALKFLPSQWISDPEARERFIHEARAASALDHPNICNIHEIEETDDGRMYIAMAYYEGESLREKIKRGPLEKNETLDIAVQMAQGMAKAHQKGIVHRDIKPANVLITNDGVAKIVDFGLAKLAGQARLTREGATIGTVAYMSPEQARGEAVDQRTDIWSLGVVLYEMLSGCLPFKGDYDQTMIHSILNHKPEPITKIRKALPPGLENIIGKALEKTAADRYQSMDELLEDLKAISEGLKPIRAKASFLSGRILGLKKIYAYVGLAGLLALIALALLFLFPKRGQAFDSIAVLPLQNLSGDPQQEYFSDGMHEALITELSRIKAIKVISRTSVMGYKGTKKRIPEIAKELGVAAIVEGSTVRSGNTVRINVQLINGRSDKHLWADNFDREYRDVLALQSKAALAIAKQIQATLTPAETEALGHKRPVDPDAYDAYLKGISIIHKLNFAMGLTEDLEKSIACFNQSLAIDRNFALAYAGLAWAYDYLALVISPKEAWPKAKSAAEKALSLDDSLADAYAVLADMKTSYEWDWGGAEKEWKRTLQLNPNYALAHSFYACFLVTQGRDKEAIFHAGRALEIDPQSFAVVSFVMTVYDFTRQFDKAIALCLKTLRQYPHDPQVHIFLSLYYLQNGQLKEGIAEYQKSIESGLPPDSGYLALAFALAGEKSKAQDVLKLILKSEKSTDANLIYFPMSYAIIGMTDQAFIWLDKCYTGRNAALALFLRGSYFDNIRGDPRFATLLKKMGLEK